jgi:Protein of unknown function (DUF3237)
MSQQNSIPELELLLVLSAQTSLVRTTSTPLGERMVVDVNGGEFAGPRLSGRVLATGGDWVLRTANGSTMSVRLVLETHDGVNILLQYTGKACVEGARVRIDVAATFEAPPPYAWLNDVQAFGQGAVTGDITRYHFYRFK